jgi:NADH:ubiquinone oxidoreductase subunit 6 (subunit J)
VIPGSAHLLAGIFGIFLLLTAGGALLAALSPRIIRGVAGLALCSLGLAGLYYFLGSPFLALMEILIYIGAVCVTIIFGVMLSETDEPPAPGRRGRERVWGALALLISAGILGAVAKLGLSAHWPTPSAHAADGSVRAIGISLLTTYSLAFELISLVLLVAILGALAIAHNGRGRS